MYLVPFIIPPFFFPDIFNFVCIRSVAHVWKFCKIDLKKGEICSFCREREENSQSDRSSSANETNMFAVHKTVPSGAGFSAYFLPCRYLYRIIFITAEPLGVGVFSLKMLFHREKLNQAQMWNLITKYIHIYIYVFFSTCIHLFFNY